jgi:hypothetical protein
MIKLKQISLGRDWKEKDFAYALLIKGECLQSGSSGL